MTDNSSGSGTATNSIVNVAMRLSEAARATPDKVAIAATGRRRGGMRHYDTITFAELDHDSSLIAAGLSRMGAGPGTRLALMVRPGIDFISLVLGILKSGCVSILIDPGMGLKRMLQCLDEIEPDGFVAIPIVHAVRVLMGRRFRKARFNLTVGRRWFWGGQNLAGMRKAPLGDYRIHPTQADDPASIIFTSGSTGPPKGVLFHHAIFDRQVVEIRDRYNIQPGEVDVPCFPLFGLFNCAMGVTAVIPEMDAARPAEVDPENIIEAIEDWQATQSFASPAVWNVVGRYCEKHGKKLPTIRRLLSAGAPVPPHVLQRMKKAINDDADIYTPYGATESLPVASISASEVLGETAAKSAAGAGTCVGTRYDGIQWRIIKITDEPIAIIEDAPGLPRGEIGELIVRGDVITKRYVTRTDANPLSKIADGDAIWHRIGDVGYLDDHDRFWMCGRKSHRVETAGGTMFTVPCEAIFNNHDHVFRSALVGVGPASAKTPVIVVEPHKEHFPADAKAEAEFVAQLLELASSNEKTATIKDVLLNRALPVDVRHNAKINREKLALWADEILPS